MMRLLSLHTTGQSRRKGRGRSLLCWRFSAQTEGKERILGSELFNQSPVILHLYLRFPMNIELTGY